jgi:hypothetical protein
MFDFKGFADMLVSLVYTLFGEFVAFDDTTMSEAVWWHAPYFVIFVLIVIFTQCEIAICFLIYLQTTTDFTVNMIRGVGVWGFFIGLSELTLRAFNFISGGALNKFAQQSTWLRFISGMLPVQDKPIKHMPTEHNINFLVTVELAEKKPHTLKWLDPASGPPRRHKSHINLFEHYKKNCLIGGEEPDATKHIKLVIEAAGILYDEKDAKRFYCKKELERLDLL